MFYSFFIYEIFIYKFVVDALATSNNNIIITDVNDHFDDLITSKINCL